MPSNTDGNKGDMVDPLAPPQQEAGKETMEDDGTARSNRGNARDQGLKDENQHLRFHLQLQW